MFLFANMVKNINNPPPMPDTPPPSAEMEKIVEYIEGVEMECTTDEVGMAKIVASLRTLQSQNTLLLEDWKEMREALIATKMVMNEEKKNSQAVIAIDTILDSLRFTP